MYKYQHHKTIAFLLVVFLQKGMIKYTYLCLPLFQMFKGLSSSSGYLLFSLHPNLHFPALGFIIFTYSFLFKRECSEKCKKKINLRPDPRKFGNQFSQTNMITFLHFLKWGYKDNKPADLVIFINVQFPQH